MKNILTIALAIFMAYTIQAQEKQKLFQKSNHWGGYGGVSLYMNSAGNFTISGEGAWIYKNFYIGGHGLNSNYGCITSVQENRDYCITRSMGGFMIGALSNNQKKIALFGEARFAFGEMMARTTLAPNVYEEYEQLATTITPTAGITFTPYNYMQLRLYGGYEYTTDFNLVGIKNDATNGAVFGLAVYFGYF